MAARQRGWPRLIGPLLAAALLALPLCWSLPLFRTEWLYVFGDEVSVAGAVRSLAATDWALCAVVVVFGIVAPVAKILALLHAWYLLPARKAYGRIALAARFGKFSMLDVMLVAVSIVALKGIGLGSVAVAPGLYAYAAVVLTVMALSFWMQAVTPSGTEVSGTPTPPPPG
jgi:paraquat-inducible protein A